MCKLEPSKAPVLRPAPLSCSAQTASPSSARSIPSASTSTRKSSGCTPTSMFLQFSEAAATQRNLPALQHQLLLQIAEAPDGVAPTVAHGFCFRSALRATLQQNRAPPTSTSHRVGQKKPPQWANQGS